MGTVRTRVAVVQLAYHPAILVDRRSPLEDPLFTLDAPDALSALGKELPEVFAPRLDALRRRIRETYDAQLLERAKAILAACRAWKVEVVVFPEYSIPWEILGGVAEAADEMVMVAGTHTVEPATKKSGIYERLALPREAMPVLGQSVAPVLHRGRLIGLSAKLNASQHEPQMRAGGAWAPIEMPGGIPGPMGILVCLDFLYREGTAHRTLVAEAMERCRFLAVPSLTPTYTLSEFAGKAGEEARRYGRPVLYCDGAEGGGTAIYVDEGRSADLRSFPEHAGLLEAGDEGVIVADVDLGYERPGRSTRYAGSHSVVPVAAATLVYRANPTADAYARWLAEAGALLSRDDDEAVEALAERVQMRRDVLLNAGALSGGAARGRRLSRLVGEIEKVTSVEEIRLLTREVVVPAGVLPLPALRAGMAKGAADAVFAWMKERRGRGLEEVERRLREAGEAAKAGEAGAWTRAGAAAIEEAALAVRGEIEEEAKVEPVEVSVRVMLPKGVDPAALGEQVSADFRFTFRMHAVEFQALALRDMRLNDPSTPLGPGSFSGTEIWAAEGWGQLAVAEGAELVAAIGIVHANQSDRRALLIISSRGDGWVLWTGNIASWAFDQRNAIGAALAGLGLPISAVEHLTTREHADRVGLLRPWIEGARKVIEELRARRLEEVKGRFEEPFARVGADERRPILAALDEWMLSTDQTALVLGEFGSGKSTALAVWAERQWQRESGPRPILVNLAGASSARDAEGLLLDAAGAQNTPASRAAIRLLVRYRFVVPCFDGFDEIATRLGAADVAGRLSMLLEIARGGPGQVLVSCRDNYFPSDAQLTTTTESALLQALGSTAGLRRIVLELFGTQQVEELVRKVCETPEDAEEALGRISQTYDLKDLVKRPLLLGMVLATLDRLEPMAAVGTADLYEAYLRRWLDQTRSGDPECFSDDQKIEFAEALADHLWRSGQASCTWQELQASVRARLAQYLPDDMPPAAAFLEIQGGAFFVREGEDRYRFAHKSFLEYFLARGLVRTLPKRPAEVLATRPITREVAAFVGEVLRREGDPKQSAAVRAVQTWLTSGRMGTLAPIAPPAIGCTLEPALLAATNALRLLLGLGRWSKASAEWILEGANLRGVSLLGEDLCGARLLKAKLNNAQLSGADLSDADLSGATLDGAQLRGVRLDKTALRRVSAQGADFTQAMADKADLEGADLSGAVLRQSMWTGCRWEGVTTEGASLTAWAAPGSGEAPAGRSPVRIDAAHVRVKLALGRQDTTHAAAWSSDRDSVAIGGDDGVISLWSVVNHALLAQFDHGTAAICAIAWSPDNARLATASYDGVIRVRNVKTDAALAPLRGHQGPARAIAWSPDGRHLASAGDDGSVRTWDTAHESELTCFAGHQGAVHALAWSPDGRHLASAGEDSVVRTWDVASGAPLLRLGGHQGSVYTIAWSPDGRHFASAGQDTDVRIWVLGQASEHARFSGHQGIISSLAWTADSKRLASASYDGTIRFWDVACSLELPYHGFDSWSRLITNWNAFISLVWNADGSQLFSVNTSGSIFTWNGATGAREMNLLAWGSARVRAVAWSPKGTHLGCMRSDREEVSLWDVARGRIDAHLRKEFAGDASAITWRPDGTCLLIGTSRGPLCLVDAMSGDTLSTFFHGLFPGGINTIAWHPDGIRFASNNDEDGGIQIWDIESAPDPVIGTVTTVRPDGTQQVVKNAPVRRPIESLQGRNGRIRALAWHPTGAWIASAGENGGVQLWDGKAFQEGATLETGGGGLHELAWSPDGALLAGCGSEGILWLWEFESNKLLAGPRVAAQRIAWHPVGKLLAIAGEGDFIRLWDVAMAKENKVILAGEEAINSLTWHPDGHWLAGTGEDGVMRIWDTDQGQLLALGELSGHTALVRTPGGFCHFIDGDPSSYRLALRSSEPTSRTELYLPLGGLHDVFYKPEKVKAALAGDLSGDNLDAELERLGLTGGVAWDGGSRHVSEEAGRNMVIDEAPPSGLLGLESKEQLKDLATPKTGFESVLEQGKDWAAQKVGVEALPRSPAAEALRDVQRALAGSSAALVVRVPNEALSNNAAFQLENSAAFQLENSAAFQLEHSAAFQLVRQLRALGRLPGAGSEALGADDDQPAATEALDAPEGPADMLNIFRPGPALADTTSIPPGRKPVITRLVDHLCRGMPTVLRGHRRSGKTSILRHLAHLYGPSAPYATLEGRRIKTAADLAHVLDPTLKGDNAADILRDRLHTEPAAVLLFDEIGNLRDAEPDLFAWIRAVGQDGTGVLLSGSPWDWTQIVRHAASAPGSSFSNDITPVDLGPLSEADAISFLVDTAPAEVPIEADKTARWIVDRCGTWPFYLQVMGDAVVRAVLAGDRRALVEAPGVSDLYEQSLFAAHDGSFQVRWEELPAAAQTIVRAIQGPTKPVYKDLGRDEQKILRDTGLCDARGQWIDDRPFFEWIHRTIKRSTKPPPAGSAPESKGSGRTPKLPKSLIDAYKKGKLALFIGSGLSRSADVKGGFPGWKDLPERLLAACAKYGVKNNKWIENKRDLFQGRMRLEEMLIELGALRVALDRDYQAALQDIFSPKDAAPGAAHRTVAALAVSAVLTTNYDQLLEIADPLPGRQPYTWRHADRALGALRGGRKVLVKVHGSVEDHESMVMSDHEYDDARSAPSYQAVLRFLLQDSMFLFIGYGMNDPLDLDLAFKANAEAFRTSAQKHFVLLRNPSDMDADRYRREYHVEVIPYSEHDDVTAFLDRLARA